MGGDRTADCGLSGEGEDRGPGNMAGAVLEGGDPAVMEDAGRGTNCARPEIRLMLDRVRWD